MGSIVTNYHSPNGCDRTEIGQQQRAEERREYQREWARAKRVKIRAALEVSTRAQKDQDKK